jgi:hypothetical protein
MPGTAAIHMAAASPHQVERRRIMQTHVSVRIGPWPGLLTRWIIFLIIIIAVARLAPGALLPLGAGTWLMGWLVSPSRRPSLSASPGGA